MEVFGGRHLRIDFMIDNDDQTGERQRSSRLWPGQGFFRTAPRRLICVLQRQEHASQEVKGQCKWHAHIAW